MSADQEELLEQFQAITGTTPEFARSFLDSSAWNLQEAVELYLGGAPPSSSSSSNNAANPFQGSAGVVPLDEDEDVEEVERIMESQGVDRETAMAIKQASGGGGGGDDGTTDGVRAPILQKRARLFDTVEQEESSLDVDVTHGLRGLTMDGAADAQMRLATQMMMGGGGAYMGIPEPSQQPSMFAPPRWMMFTGSFEDARTEGKLKQRWILVNLQEQSEFQSLVLNRDLWSDGTVQSLVQENFVFWQQDVNSTQGQTFVNLYNPGSQYPIVCIVDPRTGQRLETLKLKKKEDDLRSAFFDQITTFTDRYSFEKAKPKAVPQSSSSASSTTAAASAPPAAANSAFSGQSSEDKELAAAIQASLAGRDSTPQPTQAPAAPAPEEPATVNNNKQEIKAVGELVPLEDEPPAGKEATRVQFRFKDGTRVARRFLQSNKVDMLYSFAASKLPSGTTFELVTGEVPSRNLSDHRGATLKDANVLQASINVNQGD